jgi:hypothetical protein
LEIVNDNPDPDPNDDDNTWDFGYLSKNPNITWDDVISHPEHEDHDDDIDSEDEMVINQWLKNIWNYEELSENPNITWEIVKANRYRDWDFSRLNLKKDREKYIMDCLNEDRYNARKALMPKSNEELQTSNPLVVKSVDPVSGETLLHVKKDSLLRVVCKDNKPDIQLNSNLQSTTANQVTTNRDIMRNVMSYLGGRHKNKGKKTIKKRKTIKRKSTKKRKNTRKSRKTKTSKK